MGDSRSLDEVYCRHVLARRLPELISDTNAEPVAMAMPITAALPIVNVETRGVVGFECLLRFSAKPARTPDVWFAEAAAAHGARRWRSRRSKRR